MADQAISVVATDNAGIDSTVGSGALGFGIVGASIGISTQTITVTNTVSAYINAPVTVNNGGVKVTSGSTVTATGLAVATSVAAGFGGSAAAATRPTPPSAAWSRRTSGHRAS